MITTIYSKPDLIKSFIPLSQEGKVFLEFLLVNPKTTKVEGRGFFNDSDFLLEACQPFWGRYNFCLSNFAYAQDQIPTRGSFNQFDRSLLDDGLQDKARVHSLSLAFLFKPELIREMSAHPENTDHFLNITYQVNAIFTRLGIKVYCIDYFLTGVILRFCPSGALLRRPLNKAALVHVTKHFLEEIEKKMNTQELKRFALTANIQGKLSDPAPGLPGIFTGHADETMIVTSSGSLEPAEDAVFNVLFDDVFEPKRKSEKDAYSMPNTKGLSQNWQESPEPIYETGLIQRGRSDSTYVSKTGIKDAHTDPQVRKNTQELVAYFHAQKQNDWHWPLYSANFTRLLKGASCGEMVFLRSSPFAAELGFEFLIQSAESFHKEGLGQFLVFTKKRSFGDLAYSALSRHLKTNVIRNTTSGMTEPAHFAKAFADLFPNPPQLQVCNRTDGIDQILKYLEHDYLLKQKKRGTGLMPLAIIIDNLSEFTQGEGPETFQNLSVLKMRLQEFNATLWVSQIRPTVTAHFEPTMALADYYLSLDYNGTRQAVNEDGQNHTPKPERWEAGFHAEFTTDLLIQEFSLVKINFMAHGSHRGVKGLYAYHRPSYLFKEINPVPEQVPKSE